MHVCTVIIQDKDTINEAFDAFYQGDPVTCLKCGQPGVVTNINISGTKSGFTATIQYVHI